jgi:hypothetical protein
MSVYEESGHKWHYNPGSPGDRQCEYCGLPFVSYSYYVQTGKIVNCPKVKLIPNQRIIDGIIITGPES